MIAWSTVTTLIRKQFPKLANCRFREQGQGFGYFLCDWNGRMQCVQYTYTDQHTDEIGGDWDLRGVDAAGGEGLIRCGICGRKLLKVSARLPSGVPVGPVCGQALFIAKKKQALRRKESVRVPAVVIDHRQVDWVSMLAQGA